MKSVALLLILLSLPASNLDGSLWVDLPLEAKMTYAAGIQGGLLLAEHLSGVRGLAMRGISPERLVAEIDFFYTTHDERILVLDAILETGGMK